MTYLILRRLISVISIIFFISVFMFVSMRLIPGDPLMVMYGKEATVDIETRTALEEKLGLDQPLTTQYFLWLSRYVKGDWGTSFSTGQPIKEVVIRKFYWTFILAISSTLFAIIASIPLSIISALYHNTYIDYVIIAMVFVGQSLPNFWICIVLILLFSLELGWFPSFGAISPIINPFQFLRHIFLPTVALGSGMTCILIRLLRSGIVDEMSKDYVRTATAKGVPRLQIVLRHVLVNALIPSITIIGLWFGAAMSGAVVVESIFSYPGIGQLLIQAIRNKDYPLVQSVVFVISITFVLINSIIDILYFQIDPRILYIGGQK